MEKAVCVAEGGSHLRRLAETLEAVRPEVYVKGGDYDMATIPESALVQSWKGQCVAIPFEHERSTTELLRRIRTGP